MLRTSSCQGCRSRRLIWRRRSWSAEQDSKDVLCLVLSVWVPKHWNLMLTWGQCWICPIQDEWFSRALRLQRESTLMKQGHQFHSLRWGGWGRKQASERWDKILCGLELGGRLSVLEGLCYADRSECRYRGSNGTSLMLSIVYCAYGDGSKVEFSIRGHGWSYRRMQSADVQTQDLIPWINIAAAADCLVPFGVQVSFRLLRSSGHCMEVGDCETDSWRLGPFSADVLYGLWLAGRAV